MALGTHGGFKIIEHPGVMPTGMPVGAPEEILPLHAAQDLCVPVWSRPSPASPLATMASTFTVQSVQAQPEPSGKLSRAEGLGPLTVPHWPSCSGLSSYQASTLPGRSGSPH